MRLGAEQATQIEVEILKQVRAQPGIFRFALARKLQIAPSTITNYTERLIERGFLMESQSIPEGADNRPILYEMGRPPRALQLNPQGGRFVGVDFEARNIMAISVDFSDRPLKKVHKEIAETDSVAVIIAKIDQAVQEVLSGHDGRLLAIGVGVPGLVDPIQGIAVHYKYIKDWQNISLAEPLAKRLGVPVYLENCVRAMALAELWFGLGRGQTNWACIGIRSGIGAGIVAGGKLQRGATYRAGEIGRWYCPWPQLKAAGFFIDEHTVPPGTVELQEMASVRAILTALERAVRAGESSVLTAQSFPFVFADVVHAAQQKDSLTLKIIEVAAHALGFAIGGLALTMNPSQVILAGPLTLLGDGLLQPLRDHVERMLQATGAEIPLIVNSTIGEFSGALGAAALAVHEWRPVK